MLDGTKEYVLNALKSDCLEVATCNAMMRKFLRLHLNTERLLSSIRMSSRTVKMEIGIMQTTS